MAATEPIAKIVDTLEEATQSDEICLGDVLDEFGTAAFSSTLLAVALLLVSPLSGVPLFSSASGVAIFLIAGQGAVGRRSIWLPTKLVCLNMTSKRAERAISHARSVAAWLDRHSTRRLMPLVSPPMSRLLYAICAGAGLLLPLMEIVPMTSSLVGLSVSLIATALLARDGLIAIAGLTVMVLAASIPIAAFSAIFGS
mgnify:CR=1 FL=1